MYWQDHYASTEKDPKFWATVVRQKHSAAIYRLPDGTHFVTDAAHPGDVYPEESNLTLDQAAELYNKK
jgi:hypothetical protein